MYMSESMSVHKYMYMIHVYVHVCAHVYVCE